MEISNNKRNFYTDSSIYLTGSLISGIVPLIVLPITTRYLTPSDYGVIAIFIMFGSVSSGLLSLGLQSATFRFYFKYQKLNDLDGFKLLNISIIYFICIIFVVFCVFCFFMSDWISHYFFDNKFAKELIPLSFINGCFNFLGNYL